MIKILVSACLDGHPVRYDGEDNALPSLIWKKWQAEGRLVSICPEVAGGLKTPRAPAEIISDTHSDHYQVITIDGENVTDAFVKGAKLATQLVQADHNIQLAILKANSPSCGNTHIYDGHFSGTKIPGQGISAQALSGLGIKVFNENQLNEAESYLNQLDQNSTYD
jgi:uncharacterized protein YbbK (DUF523 family)